MSAQVFETLLVLLAGQLFTINVLRIGVSYHEIYLSTLIGYQMSWLLIQKLLDLSILYLIEDSLQQLLELILPHNGLRHGYESYLGLLSNLLIRIL